MRPLFLFVLIAHALTETLAAASLILGPQGISAAGAGEQWSMHYGFAALAMASISGWIWPHRNNAGAVSLALGVLVVFHVGLTLSLAIAGDQQVGMVLHGILAILSVVLFARKKHLTETNS